MKHLIRYHEGEFFFKDSVLKEAKNQTPSSRKVLVSMRPEDFLKLAYPGSSIEKMENTIELLSGGIKYSELPYLRCFTTKEGNLQVIKNGMAHEGRHRMRALFNLGVTSVPVLLTSERGEETEDTEKGKGTGGGPVYRWGETPKRPKLLIGHNGNKIRFPEIISRFK